MSDLTGIAADPASSSAGGSGTLADALATAVGQPPAASPVEPEAAAVKRDRPDVEPARSALVKRWLASIKSAEKHHEKAFKRMRADEDFALGKQYPDQGDDDERYRVNLVLRHMSQRTAALYARNPTFTAKRRKRMDFKLWDETPESLAQARHILSPPPMPTPPPPPIGAMVEPGKIPLPIPGGPPIAAPMMPPPVDPQALAAANALLADIQQGVAMRRQFDKVGRTMEIVFAYQQMEQLPDFKESMKQLVRRVITCSVGYVKLGYQRVMDKRPDTKSQINDITTRLDTIARLKADLADGEVNDTDAEAEELKQALAALQEQQDIILREGLVFDFPRSTDLIIDPKCRQIKGFVGADWIAEKFIMTPDTVTEIYDIDLGTNYTQFRDDGTQSPAQYSMAFDKEGDHANSMACVYELYDRKTNLKYVLAEGYPDFLTEPGNPPEYLNRFFPYYAITFNDIEHEKELFPPSDVSLLRQVQVEYNRTMEARRQHRIASRPVYLGAQGGLQEEDEKSLAHHEAHDVILLKGLREGEDPNTKLALMHKAPIDPNFYETASLFQDVLRAVGSSQAETGTPQGKATATGDSIAEAARMSALSSNADDLDELLSAMARDGGQVLLMEMSLPHVQKIAGIGAAWPELTAADICEEIYLDVKAGSSGRPNRAQEIANFERMAPLLQQNPNVNPWWLAETGARLLDDQVDLTDALIAGLPSVVSMNQNAQPSTGDATTDPNMQGGQGGANAAAPPGVEGGPQPGFPTPEAHIA